MDATRTAKSYVHALVAARIARDIDAIRRAEDEMIATDEGTHDGPETVQVYETLGGQMYTLVSFAGSNPTRHAITSIKAVTTPGRLRRSADVAARLKARRAELRQLESDLRDCY